MGYAQKNYSQKQGINGRYRIADIGCFLTSFCELQASFGNPIDPPSLDNYFRDKSIYIDVDDGIRDDLGWSSISSYDGKTQLTGSVDHGVSRTAGWPQSNNAIVRFYYKSVSSGQMIFHFCKVADWANRTIIDSWDGQVKQSPYGEPTAWATYSYVQPVSTAPQEQPVIRYEVVENYPGGKQIKLNKQPTYLWGMNYGPEQMVKTPVETHNAEEVWTVTNKVKHMNGYYYYRRDGQVDGFNILDCDDYTPPVIQTPPSAPVPLPSKYEPYTLMCTVKTYPTALSAKNDVRAQGTVDRGKYLIYVETDGMYCIVKEKGADKYWINPADNIEPPSKSVPKEETIEVVVVPPDPDPTPPPVVYPTEAEVKETINRNAWKSMAPLLPDRRPVRYKAVNTQPFEIYDLDTKRYLGLLQPGQSLHLVGTFEKDGGLYGRTEAAYKILAWPGIPMRFVRVDYWGQFLVELRRVKSKSVDGIRKLVT